MNTTNIIKYFMCNLKNYFIEEGELCVEFITKGYFSDDHMEYMFFECGIVYTEEESVFFNLLDGKYYYEGETFLGRISGKTRFKIKDRDLKILPEPLKSALKRVAYAGKCEIFPFNSSGLLTTI